MDADHRELARRLFVLAAEILEDAHPIAMRGQSPRLGAKGYLDHAERLAEAAGRLYIVVDAIGAVLRPPGVKADLEPSTRRR